MFRRKLSSLPPDPTWPAELERLGYYINDQDQVRMLADPGKGFLYKITNHERFNEVHKEAFHKCLREAIDERMEKLQIAKLYLPQLSTQKPEKGPFLPIFITAQKDLKTKNRIIIIINDAEQDLGVFAYRKICDENFDAGSATGFVKDISSVKADDQPGLILLNPGQRYFSYKNECAMTQDSWIALPKKSLHHADVVADPVHNSIPGSWTPGDHIATVFHNVVNNEEWVDQNASLYIIGISKSAGKAIDFLESNWDKYRSRIKAAAWTQPFIDARPRDSLFKTFLQTRCRAWIVDPAPLDTCRGLHADDPISLNKPNEPQTWDEHVAEQDMLVDRTEYFCPTFSGGASAFAECVFPTAYKSMLAFFDEVERGGDTYANPAFEVVPVALAELAMQSNDFGGGKGMELSVQDVDSKGNLVPKTQGLDANAALPKAEEIELKEGEVGIAGVVIEKSLLEAAGLA